MEWKRGHIIGHGSTATVSLATRNGNIIAVKSSGLSCSEPLKREERILSSLYYPNPYVVNFQGCDITMENNKLMYNLFMEYMPFGMLSQHGGQLSEQAIVCYTRQILKGLEYLHSKGFVHCDIKGANILIGDEGAKIGDLGCAKNINEGAEPIRGTPVFMAPEVARGEEQNFASDIWSLGCTIIEMAIGSSPWPNLEDPISTLFHIAYSNEVPKIPCFLSYEAKDFLRKCLRRNPNERFSASQLLKHTFLEELSLCSNYNQDMEHNSCSPTSILDQGFWSSMEELESQRVFGNFINTKKFENYIDDRIRGLAGEPCLAWWHDNHDDDNWITIRKNEVGVFGNFGSEIGSTIDDELVKSNVKDRISGHFWNKDASFVDNSHNNVKLGTIKMLLPSTLDVL